MAPNDRPIPSEPTAAYSDYDVVAMPAVRPRAGSPMLTQEVGLTGLVHYGEWGYNVFEEWLNALRGARGVKVYREMADNDSSVGASFGAIDAMVKLVKWFPEIADHPRGQEAADFLVQCIGDMSHTWQDFTGEAIVGQLTFGWSYFEKVYKYRKGNTDDPSTRSKYVDGKLGLRKLSLRAQETLDGWLFDDDGGIRGMFQRAAPKWVRTFIPIEKAILFRARQLKNNPEGRSLLRNAYRSWFFVKRLEELEAIGIERDLVGLPKMELPISYFDKSASPEKVQAKGAWQTQLVQIRRNEHDGLVVPQEMDKDGKPTGFKFSLVNSGGTRAIAPHDAIKRHRSSIGQVTLTQFIFLGMDRAGTQALSTDLMSLFSIALSAILDGFEQTFQRYGVDELLTLNGFPVESWPKWRHGDVEKKDVRPLAESLLKLVDGGLITPDSTLEDYIRNEMRLPDRDDEEVDDEGLDIDDDDGPLAGALGGAGGDATNVDAGTMVNRIATSITALIAAGDFDMANALRDALAEMLGIEPVKPLEEPDPADAVDANVDPNADPNAPIDPNAQPAAKPPVGTPKKPAPKKPKAPAKKPPVDG